MAKAKTVNGNLLQLDLFSAEEFAKPIGSVVSQETASRWFKKMHSVVDGAMDWGKTHPIVRQEQRLSLPTNQPISNGDSRRCSSHYSYRGHYRFRR
jgi:hypothetical protein